MVVESQDCHPEAWFGQGSPGIFRTRLTRLALWPNSRERASQGQLKRMHRGRFFTQHRASESQFAIDAKLIAAFSAASQAPNSAILDCCHR
jgi:hypothetical protein